MTRYTFTLRNNIGAEVSHLSGTHAKDDAEARVFGERVVRNLMQFGDCKGWSLQIREDARIVGKISFDNCEQYVPPRETPRLEGRVGPAGVRRLAGPMRPTMTRARH